MSSQGFIHEAFKKSLLRSNGTLKESLQMVECFSTVHLKKFLFTSKTSVRIRMEILFLFGFLLNFILVAFMLFCFCAFQRTKLSLLAIPP